MAYGLWLVPLALSARFFLLRLFKMIFIMKKKHRKRCFGIAVCKFKEFRYKIGIFSAIISEFLNERAVSFQDISTSFLGYFKDSL